MKKKKIFIFAYAELNLGDDLFIKILLDRYPNITFYLVAENEYKLVFEKYDNIIIIPRYNSSLFERVYSFIKRRLFPNKAVNLIRSKIDKEQSKCFKNVDSIIVIGGSLFQQYLIKPYYYELEVFKNISSYSDEKDIFFMGCNFGPFLDENFKEEFKNIFSKVKDVSFRDKKSFDLFKDLKNVRYNSDIVYTMNDDIKVLREKKSVGFSIVSPLKDVREFDKIIYIDKYVELINSYIADSYEVKLFSFCEKEKDEEIINEIYHKLNYTKNVKKIFYKGEIDVFLSEFKSVEEVYCGRFHAMILGMIYSQKIFPVIYSKKMLNVLDDLNYQGETIDIFNFNEVNIDFLRKQIFENKYNIDNEYIKANLHFEKLDIFLNQNQF